MVETLLCHVFSLSGKTDVPEPKSYYCDNSLNIWEFMKLNYKYVLCLCLMTIEIKAFVDLIWEKPATLKTFSF